MVTHQKIRAVLKLNGLKVGSYEKRPIRPKFYGDYEVIKWLSTGVMIIIHNNGNMEKLKEVIYNEGYNYDVYSSDRLIVVERQIW